MLAKMYCCAIAVLLVSTAWAAPHEGHDHGGHTAEHHHHLHHGKDEPHPSHEEASYASYLLSRPNAAFAFSLYKKLASYPEAQGENLFFSPLGISMALSMLALGANGSTHSQIYSTLGYGELQPDQVNEAYEHLFHMLNHNQGNMELEAGSAVAIGEGFKVKDKFLNDSQHYYNSEAFNVDFSKPEIAAEEINKYIAKKTHDKITDMVKDLDKYTVMMLINYMYFKGKWDEPFDVNLTHKADFQVDKDTTVKVDMMRRTGYYLIYRDTVNQITVMKVPYKGSTSMMIVLPDYGKMKEVEEYISGQHIKIWHEKFINSTVDLFMPKFSISSKFNLNTILQEMGITDAFNDTADFSRITEEAKVKVSKVDHQAVLSVDEEGAEGVAATTVEITTKYMPERVMLNRPFMVLILEKNSKSIIFMGKITDPTV